MKRPWLLLLALVFAVPAFAQTNSNDSDTLKSLLAEVHMLRQDLRMTTIAAQKAQILLYRIQVQESVVRLVQERVDDTRSKLSQLQLEQRNRASAMKQIEEKRGQSLTTIAEQKELEGMLGQMKTKFDADANKEQEIQTKLNESEEQLRLEQAKLVALQDQLDRLEKGLESFDHAK